MTFTTAVGRVHVRTRMENTINSFKGVRAVTALAALLVGYLVGPVEPLLDRLDFVQVGMTQNEVEEILGGAGLVDGM